MKIIRISPWVQKVKIHQKKEIQIMMDRQLVKDHQEIMENHQEMEIQMVKDHHEIIEDLQVVKIHHLMIDHQEIMDDHQEINHEQHLILLNKILILLYIILY